MNVCDSMLQERRQIGNEKNKPAARVTRTHPNHFDFESGTYVSAVVAYSDWQKELQVRTATLI